MHSNRQPKFYKTGFFIIYPKASLIIIKLKTLLKKFKSAF